MSTKNYNLSNIASNIEFGLGGPRIKIVNDILHVRNQADDAYALLRAGSPVGDNDVATKKYIVDNFQSALGFTPENVANKGAANGYASLNSSGLIPSTQLPSYVDDVLEYTNLAAFPVTGETGKIYVALDTNKTYRWSGSAYIYITSGAVDSVNGQTGVVSLSYSNVGAAAASHAHGNITSVGAIGSTANLPIITTASGVLTTSSFGSDANTFCQGNDSRLSNSRTPTAHNLIDTTGHPVSGLTAGQYIRASGATAYAFSGIQASDVPTLNQNTTGNAATATALATARDITIGSGTKSFNGSANISYTLAEIGAAKRSVSYPSAFGYISSDPIATYRVHGAATGTLKISLPIGWTNTMITFDITVFDYGANNGSTTWTVSGFNYIPSPAWVYPAYVRSGKLNLSVRFGFDGTNVCILIGTISTAWSYPHVSITNLKQGHNNTDFATLLDSSWNIGFLTDESSLSYIVSGTDNTNSTKLTTARTIQTNLSSVSSASFDGTANITPGVTGTLGAANGGTGLTSISTLLNTNNTLDTVLANGSTSSRTITSGRLNMYKDGTPTANLGEPSVLEAALFEGQLSNKLRFYDPTKFTFEYTLNDVDWVSDTYPDTNKIKDFVKSGSASAACIVPYGAIKYRIRISATSYFSTTLLYMYISGAANGLKIHINRKNNVGDWVSVTASDSIVNYISSPSHIYVQFPTVWLIPTPTQAAHSTEIEFIFIPTWNNTNYISFLSMELWGGYPSGSREIYTWDSSKNVTYPANVIASQLYEGANRVYSANNTNIGSGATNYAAGNHTHNTFYSSTSITDVNQAIENYIFKYNRFDSGISNAPTWIINNANSLITINSHAGGYAKQIGFSDSEELYIRRVSAGAFQPWRKLWHDGNLTPYSHPTGDGNLHVPATSTTNDGKVLTAGSTAGSLSWLTPNALANVTAPVLTITPDAVGSNPVTRYYIVYGIFDISGSSTRTPVSSEVSVTTGDSTTSLTFSASSAYGVDLFVPFRGSSSGNYTEMLTAGYWAGSDNPVDLFSESWSSEGGTYSATSGLSVEQYGPYELASNKTGVWPPIGNTTLYPTASLVKYALDRKIGIDEVEYPLSWNSGLRELSIDPNGLTWKSISVYGSGSNTSVLALPVGNDAFGTIQLKFSAIISSTVSFSGELIVNFLSYEEGASTIFTSHSLLKTEAVPSEDTTDWNFTVSGNESSGYEVVITANLPSSPQAKLVGIYFVEEGTRIL